MSINSDNGTKQVQAPTLDQVTALNGRIYETLTNEEREVLEYFLNSSRCYNLSIAMIQKIVAGSSTRVVMIEDQDHRVKAAEKNLAALLNYGGIHPDDSNTESHVCLAYEEGELVDEIVQMRSLASAFNELANALELRDDLENKGLPAEEHKVGMVASIKA